MDSAGERYGDRIARRCSRFTGLGWKGIGAFRHPQPKKDRHGPLILGGKHHWHPLTIIYHGGPIDAALEFVGLGWTMPALTRAVFYGAVQTAFAEEVLFRGLIAGSLARRLPALWADLIQAVIFLFPHLLILLVAPEAWVILPVVFAGALFFGWIRIKSGSILGPWLMHASGNIAMAMTVAIRTAP